MYVHFVFLSSANLHQFPKKKNKVIQKENMSCISRYVLFMCGINFQTAIDTAMKAMSLLTLHVIKKNSLLFDETIRFKKKLLLNKRYHFLRYIFICDILSRIYLPL